MYFSYYLYIVLYNLNFIKSLAKIIQLYMFLNFLSCIHIISILRLYLNTLSIFYGVTYKLICISSTFIQKHLNEDFIDLW